MKPKVSVIVPVYNVESYLDRCVYSLINQTLQDIEIILVDDGSLDNSPKLCNAYQNIDSRIKVIHKENGGLGFARNSGLDIASGQFVAFVDSDDWLDLHMYETLYQIAITQQCDTVYCSLQYFYSEKDIRPFKEVDKLSFYNGTDEIKEFILDMLAPAPSYSSDVKYMVSVCKALYSRNLIEDNNLRFCSEKEVASEDMLFHIDYLRHSNKIGFIPQYFYNYFQNTNSITHTYSDDKIERLKCFLNQVHQKYAENYNEKEYYQRLQRKSLHYLRTALTIKYKMSSKYNFIYMYSEFLRLCGEKEFKLALNDYPYRLLDYKHKVFFLLVKYKMISLLILMNILKNR